MPRTTIAKRRGRPKDRQLAARRREEILDVATRVFAERGFPGADVQIVADDLGVGKGTIYRYFPTKRELFLAAVDRGMRRLWDRVDLSATDAEDPLERFCQAVRAYLGFFDANPQYVELLIQERAEFKDRKKPTYFEHRDASVGPWQDLFRDLVAVGRVRDIPIERITDVVGYLVYGAMFTNYFTSQRRPSEEQAQDVLDILFSGILPGDGREHVADE